jgi:subtilase family protein
VTKQGFWYSTLLDRAAAEAEIIVDAFHDQVEIGGVRDRAVADDNVHDGGIAFMYAKGHLLTREQYLGDVGVEPGCQSLENATKKRGVLSILEDEGFHSVEVTRVVRDIVLLRLCPPFPQIATEAAEEPDEDETGKGEPPDEVLYLLRLIDRELGVGIATPDHVLTAANGEMYPCSATEPEEVLFRAGPDPAVCRDGGARVRIFVADTGLVKDWATTFPWLHGVHGAIDPQAGTGPGVAIPPYGGHGTFVTGVLRCMAPDAQVHVANVFDTAGSVLESELVQRLNPAFGFGFEILHLTASCMTRKNIPPLALEAWLELLRAYKGVVCVAPAGNNHTRRPSWPGAFPDVISVGALAADWHHRADFSDHGGWVDVYAPGEKLINAFGSGEYTGQFGAGAGLPRTFTGLAQWSGTSFSAPIVTGLIAARMARCGESAREAADALLARARDQAIPGVGPVLLPSCGGEGDECRGGCGRCGDCGCGHGGCGGHGCGDHRCGGRG